MARAKRRCLTGECDPKSKWIKASRLRLLVPRSTARFRQHYSKRGAVERKFGDLKRISGMLPLRFRRLPRVALHVDLTILAVLADAAVRCGVIR